MSDRGANLNRRRRRRCYERSEKQKEEGKRRTNRRRFGESVTPLMDGGIRIRRLSARLAACLPACLPPRPCAIRRYVCMHVAYLNSRSGRAISWNVVNIFADELTPEKNTPDEEKARRHDTSLRNPNPRLDRSLSCRTGSK